MMGEVGTYEELSLDILKESLDIHLRGKVEDVHKENGCTVYDMDIGQLKFKRTGDYIYYELYVAVQGQFISFLYDGVVKDRTVTNGTSSTSYVRKGGEWTNDWIEARYELPDDTVLIIECNYYFSKGVIRD